MLRWAVAVSLLLGSLIIVIQQVHSCNEAVCGSIVSKCLLTQSCKCDLKNCTCCKECFSCLQGLFSECCSCVDMCPRPNETGSLLWKKSNVEEFSESEQMPQLFQTLTEANDTQNRWTSYTYPNELDTLLMPHNMYHLQSIEQPQINCTVAFMSTCMNWEKCKASCHSMGSASYRWFHDGCCECIGRTCINYGKNESRCLNCPPKDEEDDDYSALNEDDNDYGESDDFEDD